MLRLSSFFLTFYGNLVIIGVSSYETKIISSSLAESNVENLINLVEQNGVRAHLGLNKLPVVLNRLFLGNPGTGKTTVATIYAKVIANLGLLSTKEVIFMSASDFLHHFRRCLIDLGTQFGPIVDRKSVV